MSCFRAWGRIAAFLWLGSVCASAAVTIDVSTFPTAYRGGLYAYTVPTTGRGPTDQCVGGEGSWPSGMTLNPANCLVHGYGPVAGTYTFTLKVVNGSTVLASKTISWETKGDLSAYYPPTSGRVGQPVSIGLSIFIPSPPAQFVHESGVMPPGMGLNATTGELSGTPTAAGTFRPLIAGRDAAGNTAYAVAAIEIIPTAITLTPPNTGSLPRARVGYPWSVQFSAQGGRAPYRFEAINLPSEVTMSPTGLLSGALFELGISYCRIQATDADNRQSGFIGYAWLVDEGTAVELASGPLPEGMENTPYSARLTAIGLGSGITVSATGALPPGLTLTMSGAASAELRGTPTLAGLYNFVVRFADSAGLVAKQAYRVWIGGVAGEPLVLTTASLPVGQIGVPYSVQLSATGGRPPYTFAFGPVLPGLEFNAQTGAITGTPLMPCKGDVWPAVWDSIGGVANRRLAFEIKAPNLELTHTQITEGWPHTYYPGFEIAFKNAVGNATIAIDSGTLPPGLEFNKTVSGGDAFTVGGVPTSSGVFTPRIRITDSLGVSGTLNITITIRSYTLTLLPASAPDGIMNVVYQFPLRAEGGTPPYRYFFIAPGTMNSFRVEEAGAISGYPSDAATYTGRVGVQDATGARGERLYSVRVFDGGLTIGGSLPQMTFRQPYAAQLTASGGTPPYKFSLLSGALPAGVSISQQGLVSGTPTQVMTGHVQIVVTDAASRGGSRGFDFTVAGPSLSLGPDSIPDGVSGKFYSFQLTASGGRPPYKFTLMESPSFPFSLKISQDGVLSGTHVTSTNATYTFLLAAEDPDGLMGARWMSISIKGVAGLHLGPETLPAGKVGATYSAWVLAGGGSEPYVYSILSGTLPPGVSLISDGRVTGLPQQAGTFPVTMGVRDGSAATASKLYSITIAGAGLTITPSALPPATVGQAYSQQFGVSGGQAPYTWELLPPLPSGMSLSPQGLLSGTPQSAGSWSVGVRVSDFSGLWLEKSYTLEVAPSGSVQIQPAGLPRAKVGVAFDQQFSCSGAQGPCQFSVAAGALPPGMELTAQGRLHGTPAQMGAVRFTIDARDQGGAQARREYEVESDGVAMMPAAWKPAETGVAVNEQLSVDPQLAGIQFRIAGGSLPSGVTLGVDGALRGSATMSGTYTVVVDAVWKGFRAGSRSYQLQVIEPLRLVADKLHRVQTGAFYRAALEARGGRPPYSYSSSGQLPAGLRLEAAGWISGIAETAGDYTINVTVTDSAGLTNSGAVAVKVENVGVKITTTWLPDGKADADYSATIMATGGTPPYRWSILEGYLPNSFALSSDGVLRGRIPYPVAINLTAIVVDAEGREARQLLTLNIKPAEPQSGLFTVQPAELGFQADEGSREEMSRCLSVYATGQPASVRAAVVSEAGSAWLTLSGAEARTPGLICAIVKPGDTAAGQWNKTIELTVTGATPAKVRVPVLLRILPQPQAALAVLPTAVKLSAPAGAGTVSTTLRLANEGTAEATVSASAKNPGWLAVPAGPWILQPFQSSGVEVQVDVTGLSPGLYSSAVDFRSGGISATASIDLLVGAAGKMLEIDRKSITFATWPGSDNPQPQSLMVRNAGAAGVTLSIASAAQDLPPWLVLPETGCRSAGLALNPGETCALNLHVNAQGLDAGVRQAVLRIAGAAVPVDVLVTLIVGSLDSSGATAPGSAALLFVHGLEDSAKGQDVVLPGPPSRKGKVSWAVSAGERVDWLKVSPPELETSLSGTVQFNLDVDWTAGLKEGVNRAVLRLSFADGGSQSIHVVALAIPDAKLQSLQSGPAAASCGDRLFAVVLDPTPEFRATMPDSLPVMAALFDCAGQPAGGLDVFAALGGISQRLSGDGKGRYSSALPLGEASDAAVLTISGWLPGGAATASDEVSGKVRQAEDGSPAVSQVLNGMGYQGPVVPDSWITIKGRGFAAQPAEDPDLPESLSGVSASLGGVSLKLRGAGADSIVAYVPHSLPSGGRSSLTVASGGRMSAPFEVVLTTHAPLLYAQEGSGVALGWCEETVAGISAASPVPSGCVLHLYASGIGAGISPIVLAGPAEILPESVSKLEGHPGFQEVVFKLPHDMGGAPEIAIQLKQGALVSNKVLVPLKAN